MPFDFTKNEFYSIDYMELFNDLKHEQILKNKYIQDMYLREWINVLNDAEIALRKSFSRKEDIVKFNMIINLEPEIFQIPIERENNTIYIHFRVSEINRTISEKDKEKYSEVVDINEFVNKGRNIFWTPVEGNVDKYKNVNQPVIMIPFLYEQYNRLIIDGNHRLTYRTKNKLKNIKVLTVSHQSIIQNNMFASGFDKLFYIMINELACMHYETNKNNIHAEDLIYKSYLVDGKFKFSI